MGTPVKHTCPDIDRLIKKVNEVLSIARNSDEGVSKDDIFYRLSDFEYELEKLRSSNDSLRSWGEELECRLEDMESESDEMQRSNEDLTERANKLEQLLTGNGIDF